MRHWIIALLLVAGTAAAAPPPETSGDPVAAEAIRYIEQGRPALSIPMLESVIARLPGNPDLLTYLALALRLEGRHAEAAARYEQALARDAAYLPALAYQGILFLQTGQRDRAQANMNRLVALCRDGCPEREDLAREMARGGSQAPVLALPSGPSSRDGGATALR